MPVRGPDGAGTLPDDPLAGFALAGDAVTGNLRLGGDATTEIVNNNGNVDISLSTHIL